MTGATWLFLAASAGAADAPEAATATPAMFPSAWEFTTAQGGLGRVVVRAKDGAEVVRLHCQDGGGGGRMGWAADRDPRPGRVRCGVDATLSAGTYTVLTETAADGATSTLEVGPTPDPSPVQVPLPPGATAVRGWRVDRGSGQWTAVTWADADAQRAEVQLPGAGWQLSAVGAPRPHWAQAPQAPAAVEPLPRLRDERWRGLMLGLLAALVVSMGLLIHAAWRARRRPGWLLGGLPAVGVAGVALWPCLPDIGAALLSSGGPVTDPRDSAALLAQLTDAILHGSDVGHRFRYPEGSSWLAAGPAWLGYLPALPIALISGPIAGHNLGVAIWMGLLAWCLWGLARDRGAGPLTAMVATAGALSPAITDELDALSLDRATLVFVPLFVLLLDRTARRPGPWWPLLGGVCLGMALQAQVYYGLYLAIAAPLLVLPRLFGGDLRRRALRFTGMAAIATVVAAPSLHALTVTSADSPYTADTRRLLDTAPSLLKPVSTDVANAFLADHTQRRGATRAHALSSPEERLLSAAALSLSGDELLAPRRTLPGRALYWPLALLAVFAATRRRAVALGLFDVTVLLLLAAGPFLRWKTTWTGIPLPYYAPFLGIPGWEQLKNVHRYALMAATVSAVPLALALDDLLRRRGRGWIALGAGGLTLLLVGLRSPRFDAPTPTVGATAQPPLVALSLPASRVRPVPRSRALAALGPGPVLALPMTHPTADTLVMVALAHDLSLVNDPPFETPRAAPTHWFEDNALVNRLAHLSGSQRPHRILDADDYAHDIADLHRYGMTRVLLSRRDLADPLLEAPLVALLDRLGERVSADDLFIAWRLDP